MNKNLLRLKYILFDMLAAAIVWLLFMVFRRVVNDGRIFEGIPIFIPNYNYYSTFLLFPIFCIIIHYLSGYYVNPIKESKLNELIITFVSSIIISIIVFFVLLLDDIVVDYSYYYYSLLVLFGLLFSITSLFRMIQTTHIKWNFKKKKWTINTLIIGTGKNAQKIADDIRKNSYFNTVVGFIKIDENEKDIASDDIVGNTSCIAKCIFNLQIKEAIVALDNPSEQKIFDIISKLFQYGIDIRFTPRLYEILTGKAKIDKYGINPLVNVSQPTMSDWELCVKRTFDIIISILSLIILFPLIIYFYFAIRLDSKGPAIFKQERIGQYGKPFKMLKFRTMYSNAENGIPKLSNPNDVRVTKLGKFLRKYRLDEIPQFFNVIKGDMSFVGPRPERKYYIDQIIQLAPYYCLLYRIRPGLTSWGPIKIGYSDSIEKMIDRLNFDIVYMENMNLLTDFKIILSTLEIIFRGQGM